MTETISYSFWMAGSFEWTLRGRVLETSVQTAPLARRALLAPPRAAALLGSASWPRGTGDVPGTL